MGTAMGIVLEMCQPADGGRWEQPRLDPFLGLLFVRCLYFQLGSLLTILSCLFLYPHPYLFVSSYPALFPSLVSTPTIPEFMKGYTACVCFLINPFPVPLSLPPELILKLPLLPSACRCDPAVETGKNGKHPVCLCHVLPISFSTIPSEMVVLPDGCCLSPLSLQ